MIMKQLVKAVFLYQIIQTTLDSSIIVRPVLDRLANYRFGSMASS